MRCTMHNTTSHHKTSAGTGAPRLTLIALVWNALVWGFLISSPGPAVWFKGFMVLVGAGIALFAALLWLSGRRNAGVTLQLSQDPVPHGIPTTATFTLARPQRVQNWALRVTIDSPDEDLSGFGRVWDKKVTTTAFPTLVDGELMVQSIQAEFTLPADLPSTAGDVGFVSLVLEGEDGSRTFVIATQPETARQPTDDAPRPVSDTEFPALVANLQNAIRWVRRGAYAISFGVVGWVVWGVLQPLWSDMQPGGEPDAVSGPLIGMSVDSVQAVGEERARDVGESDASWRLSTHVRTPEFDVLLSNWLSGDGQVRAHLQSRTQVNRGKLRMRIQHLALAPAGACMSTGNCQVESIRLVLSQATSDGTTTILAQSNPLAWAVDLANTPLAQRSDGIFQLTLPESLAGDQDVRLQLVIRTANADGHTALSFPDDTTYASHGNHMGLQLALRAANPESADLMDPCDRVGSLGEAIRAHCEGQVQFRLDSKAFSGRKELDAALIDAIKHYNSAAVRPLLKAGASPNAVDPQQKSASALMLATAGDQQEVRAALIKAGALNAQ
jgi:hypothetical protein